MARFTVIGKRLSYRIAFAASLLAGVFILAIGGASYIVMRSQMTQSIDDVIYQSAVMRANHIEGLLNSIVFALSSWANNALIANALVDSAGRDIYLIPFIQDLTTINGVPIRPTVTDFEGKPLASGAGVAEAGFSYSAIVRRVVEKESPLARIQQSTDGDILILVEPIVHPLTESAEGAVVLELAVKDLLVGANRERVAGEAKLARLLYANYAGEERVSAEHHASEGDIKVIQPINVADYLAPLGLALEVTADEHILTGPLTRLSIFYLALGIVTILAVLLLSLVAGRHLVRPIRKLEQVARSVIASGSFDHRFKAGGC